MGKFLIDKKANFPIKLRPVCRLFLIKSMQISLNASKRTSRFDPSKSGEVYIQVMPELAVTMKSTESGALVLNITIAKLVVP